MGKLGWASRVVALAMMAVMAAATTVSTASAVAVAFVGDYSTGDFSQWAAVQNRDYNGPARDFHSNEYARIVDDDIFGKAARFEIQPGEPTENGKERSEVASGYETGGPDGQVMWYQFSTKFDPTFPLNHADLGMAITNQFWGAAYPGTPIVWSAGSRNGYWTLAVLKRPERGADLKTFPIFETPLSVGTWHNVTMQIRWSKSNQDGWIKLWLNGERQLFLNSSSTFVTQTLNPGTEVIRYKEGYYRQQSPDIPAGVVYHAAFRCGNGAPPL